MNEREKALAERVAKALNVPVETVEKASFVILMEKLVEVIERDRVPNA